MGTGPEPISVAWQVQYWPGLVPCPCLNQLLWQDNSMLSLGNAFWNKNSFWNKWGESAHLGTWTVLERVVYQGNRMPLCKELGIVY